MQPAHMIEISDKRPETAILIGVFTLSTHRTRAEEHLDELALLADTAGATVIRKILQQRDKPEVFSYIGKGKLQELKAMVEETNADLVIVDDELTPTQARNIQKVTETKVLDRPGLILDIFASRAKSAASRTQVEVAQLEYILPRLTRLWTHLSRQKGGVGTKGPGETQIETDRRLVGKRILVLKDRLKTLSRQRETQRQGRGEFARVSLVGYTNAGKSSLMNTLVNAGVFAEDRLFATLDATVRRFEVDGRTLLLSDTVGFIRKLPHGLVESFKSTLDEIRESDLLLHVVDVSSAHASDHIRVVRETLRDIGAEETPEILVFNKVDRIDSADRLTAIRNDHPGCRFVSAMRGIGLDDLKGAITERLSPDETTLTLLVDAAQGRSLSRIHEWGRVECTDVLEDQIRLQVKLPNQYLDRVNTLPGVRPA
jgi:GTPase